jgi:hypothetical protein
VGCSAKIINHKKEKKGGMCDYSLLIGGGGGGHAGGSTAFNRFEYVHIQNLICASISVQHESAEKSDHLAS